MKIIILTIFSFSFYTISVSAHNLYARQSEVQTQSPANGIFDALLGLLNSGGNSQFGNTFSLIFPMFENLFKQMGNGASGKTAVVAINGFSTAAKLITIPLGGFLGPDGSKALNSLLDFFGSPMCVDGFIDVVIPSLFTLFTKIVGMIFSTGSSLGNNFI